MVSSGTDMAPPPDETRNPFTMLSARQVYDNPWISVVEHQVLSPQGRPGIYGVVKFKNQAVGVIPYQDGKIWLVGQYRVPLGAYSWEIPEGGAPYGEDPVEGARRELREETGMDAGSLRYLTTIWTTPGFTDEQIRLYLATDLTAGETRHDADEFMEMVRLPLSEALGMVRDGAITDGKTICTLLYAAGFVLGR